MGLFKKLKSKLKKDKAKQKAARAKRQAKVDEYKKTTSVSPISKHHTKKSVSTKTKGGDYKVYKKKSKTAKSFRSSFAAARKAGKKSFTWNDRSYSTARADDKPASVDKYGNKSSAEEGSGYSEERAKAQLGGVVPPARRGLPQRGTPQRGTRPIVPSPPVPQIVQAPGQSYEEGGKVESNNPYGWPVKDSRGKK